MSLSLKDINDIENSLFGEVTSDDLDEMSKMLDTPEPGPPAETTAMGLAGAVGRGAVEGLTTVFPEMVGGAMQFLGDKTGLDTIESAGAGLKEWSQEKSSEWFGPQPNRSTIENIAYEGTKMLAPSVIPGAALTVGFRGLLGVGRIAGAARAAAVAAEASGAAEDIALATNLAAKANKFARIANSASAATNATALFGLSQAQQTIDSAEETAKQLESIGDFEGATKAREAGQGISPYLTGAIEAAGEYFGTKYLGKLFGLDEAEVLKKGAKELAKDLLKTLGVEVGTEVGQALGEAGVEKYSGIRPDADPLGEALSVIGPTAFMTLLTGGIASGAHAITGRDAGTGPAKEAEDHAKSIENAMGSEADPRTIDDIEKEIDNTEPLSDENDAANDAYLDKTINGKEPAGRKPEQVETPPISTPEPAQEAPGTPAYTPEQLDGIEVNIKAVEEETGNIITMKEQASVALNEIDSQSETYYSMLECVG